jgi:tight adherence protein C
MDIFRLREKIHRKITAAHIKLLPEEFFSIKIALMIILFWLAFIIYAANPMLAVIALIAAYLLPDFWLANKIRLRKQAIIRLLPETVDLLSLCIEAGLEFTTAVDWIIKKAPKVTPMVEELTVVLEEIKWGKSRSQALKDMSKRLNLASVTSFSQTLIQGERMGTPIVESFNILSEDIRLQRFHRGERKALQAPIKMLIPLIFFILPVIAIIIGGPILIQFSHGDLFKGF